MNKKKLDYHSCDTIFLKDWMTYILYMNDNYINTYPLPLHILPQCLIWQKIIKYCLTANLIQLFSDVLCISIHMKSQLWRWNWNRIQCITKKRISMLYDIIYFQITIIVTYSASCLICEILHLDWITKLSWFLQLDTIDSLVGTRIAFCHIE